MISPRQPSDVESITTSASHFPLQMHCLRPADLGVDQSRSDAKNAMPHAIGIVEIRGLSEHIMRLLLKSLFPRSLPNSMIDYNN